MSRDSIEIELRLLEGEKTLSLLDRKAKSLPGLVFPLSSGYYQGPEGATFIQLEGGLEVRQVLFGNLSLVMSGSVQGLFDLKGQPLDPVLSPKYQATIDFPLRLPQEERIDSNLKRLEIQKAIFLQSMSLEALNGYEYLIELNTNIRRSQALIGHWNTILGSLDSEVRAGRVSEIEVLPFRRSLAKETLNLEIFSVQHREYRLTYPFLFSSRSSYAPAFDGWQNPKQIIRNFEWGNMVQSFESERTTNASHLVIDGFCGKEYGVRVLWTPRVSFLQTKRTREAFELAKEGLSARHRAEELAETQEEQSLEREIDTLQIQIQSAQKNEELIEKTIDILRESLHGGIQLFKEIANWEHDQIEIHFEKELLQDRQRIVKIRLQLLYGDEPWLRDTQFNQTPYNLVP